MSRKITPEDKAIQRFSFYYLLITNTNSMASSETRKSFAKQCVIGEIDEILDVLENGLDFKMKKSIDWFNSVKEQLNKL